MSAAVLGPDRWLGWVVRLAGVCVAAILAAALLGTFSFGSRPAFSGAAAQSADSWARVPLAAREAISRDLGLDQGRYAVKRVGARLAVHGSGFSATFGRGGAIVRAGQASLQFGLMAIGRGRSLRHVASAPPTIASNTVSYAHRGIKEWYSNGPLGLEQRFTVERRPKGVGDLKLVVGRLSPSTRAISVSHGAGLDLAAHHGASRAVRYSDLTVTDSAGHRVAARITISRGDIILRIRDARARYPLRIDPTVQAGGATLTDGSYDPDGGFGTSVAVSDDGGTIVVGAGGIVYVFTVPAGGDWQDATPTAHLAVAGGTSTSFGDSVAVSGDGSTIVAGSPSLGSVPGAVYVYSEPASGGWQNATQTAELTTSSNATDDFFGWSVAVSRDGGTVAVGAPGDFGSTNTVDGAAYVFSEPASGGWQNATQTAELTGSDGEIGDQFGRSVAVSGDGETIVAGAGNHQVGSVTFAGAVYVFTKPAPGGWQNSTQTAELTESDHPSGDTLGWSVAVSGDGGTIAAGAEEAVYVFSEPPSGGWQDATPTAKLTEIYDANANAPWFSVAIADDGGTVVAGSITGAYVFTQPGSGWQDTSVAEQLKANSGLNGGGDGIPVATAGDRATVAVAEPYLGRVQLFPPSPANVAAPTVSGSPVSGEILADHNGSWSGNVTGYLYQWEDCSTAGTHCSPIFDATNQTYTLTNADVGATVEVQESGTSATGTGAPASATASEVVQPLSAITLPTISGQAVQGHTLTETDGSWNATVSGNAYQWEDCDSYGENCSPIDGATDQSYTVQDTDVGSTIEVQETASNDGGPGVPASSAPTQAAQALVTTSAPMISGLAVQGQTLTETNASWNSSVGGYVYQWEECDTSGENCSPIDGANDQSYTLTNADAGHRLVVAEDAFNDGGLGLPATSGPTSVVIPLVPTTPQVPTISGTAIDGNVLSASLLAWSNTPTSVSYQWEDCDSNGQNCRTIAGATSKTYTLAAGDIGSRVAVEESASNAGGASAPATSERTAAVPESGPVGLEIDNGNYATNNPNVTIEAVWPAGTRSILISNNGGFRTETQTLAPAGTLNWRLEQTGSDRLPKTVYVRFLGVGQDDINFTDDIILDETAPTVQSATASGPGVAPASAARAPRLKAYKLRLKARDQVVGICAVATNRRRSATGEALTTLTSCTQRGILKLSRTLHLKLATAPRYVRVCNSAGDWSRWLKVTS